MREFKVTRADMGKHLEVRPGDTIVLELDEDPATGFRWIIHKGNTDVLEIKDSFIAEPFEANSGAMVTRRMIFSAREAGIALLQLKYMREWEKASATAQRLNLTVIVK